jgi:hypothetical protein
MNKNELNKLIKTYNSARRMFPELTDKEALMLAGGILLAIKEQQNENSSKTH